MPYSAMNPVSPVTHSTPGTGTGTVTRPVIQQPGGATTSRGQISAGTGDNPGWYDANGKQVWGSVPGDPNTLIAKPYEVPSGWTPGGGTTATSALEVLKTKLAEKGITPSDEWFKGDIAKAGAGGGTPAAGGAYDPKAFDTNGYNPQIQKDFDAYFANAKPGSVTPCLGGTLTMGADGKASYTDKNGRSVLKFNKDTSLFAIGAGNKDIRDAWAAKYGIDPRDLGQGMGAGTAQPTMYQTRDGNGTTVHGAPKTLEEYYTQNPGKVPATGGGQTPTGGGGVVPPVTDGAGTGGGNAYLPPGWSIGADGIRRYAPTTDPSSPLYGGGGATGGAGGGTPYLPPGWFIGANGIRQ